MRHLYKTELMFAIIGLLVVGILFFQASFDAPVTGFVSALNATLYIQNLDLYADGTQTYSLTSTTTNLPLEYLSIDGEIIGDGRVEIFIDNNNGSQYLIYQNLIEKINHSKSRNIITGMAAETTEEAQKASEIVGKAMTENHMQTSEGIWLVIQPKKVNIPYEFREIKSNEEKTNGTFYTQCIETCQIPPGVFNSDNYEMSLRIENGTYVKLTRLKYILYQNAE
jgi:hypothetical protein